MNSLAAISLATAAVASVASVATATLPEHLANSIDIPRPVGTPPAAVQTPGVQSAAVHIPAPPPSPTETGTETGAEAGKKSPLAKPQEKSTPATTRNGTDTAPLVSARDLDPGFTLQAGGRPRYPARAKRLGRSGTVRLEILINTDGSVAQVKVREESQGWGFGAAARKAFSLARFTPPTVTGTPVRVLWRKTLRFQP